MLNKPNVYFIGIGGIGMSALARYFKKAGHKVGGYDRFPSPLCQSLEKEGMKIIYEDDIDLLQTNFKHPEETLVVYTPAIPRENNIKSFFAAKGFELFKRADILGELSKRHTCLAVAGTHGKTTTSTLLAHMLRVAEIPSLAFLGGIAADYGTNFWGDPKNEIMVAEADEYDRSFLKLSPHNAIITSTQADHLDIYESEDDLKNTFSQFATNVGHTVLCESKTQMPYTTYGVDDSSTWRAENIEVMDHSYQFNLVGPEISIDGIISPLPGKHNIENIVAASALAYLAGAKPGQIKLAIENFRGIKRRFEYHIKTPKLVMIDDYAHHPDEINALLETVTNLYPKKKLTVIFQPHLFSRTRDFLGEFAQSLSPASELFLMPIYPAREKPIPGITSEKLAELVPSSNSPKVMGETELLDYFKSSKPEVLLTVGAGSIDRLVSPLKSLLLK